MYMYVQRKKKRERPGERERERCGKHKTYRGYYVGRFCTGDYKLDVFVLLYMEWLNTKVSISRLKIIVGKRH